MQGISHHQAAVLRIAIRELLIQAVNPRQECLLGSGRRRQRAIFVSGHSEPRWFREEG
jgi:hypothetical protein